MPAYIQTYLPTCLAICLHSKLSRNTPRDVPNREKLLSNGYDLQTKLVQIDMRSPIGANF